MSIVANLGNFSHHLLKKGLVTEADIQHALDLKSKKTRFTDDRYRKIANSLILIQSIEEEVAVKELNEFNRENVDPYVAIKSFPLTEATARAMPLQKMVDTESVVLEIDTVSNSIIVGTCSTERSTTASIVQMLNGRFSGFVVSFRRVLEAPLQIRLEQISEYLGSNYKSVNINIGVEEKIRTLFRDAIKYRASDVSIEPDGGGSSIYFVIDQIREKYKNVSFRKEEAEEAVRNILTQAKIPFNLMQTRVVDCALSDIGISKEYRVRINKMDAYRGDLVNMRMLPKQHDFKTISKLNYTEQNSRFLEHHRKPRGGIVLFSGETNSGKNTSAFSYLTELTSHYSLKIISVEDPVEYEIEGVTQIEAHSIEEYHQISRGLVRQSPNVIYQSEMRDKITVETALDAASTGKLVVSSIHLRHVYDFFSRIEGLAKEDVSTDLISEMLGLMHQALLPKSCSYCQDTVNISTLSADVRRSLGDYTGSIIINKPVGCPHCNGRGVKGVVPVAEYLNFDYKLKSDLRLAKTSAERQEIIIANQRKNKCSFSEDGLRHMNSGNVSLKYLLERSILNIDLITNQQ